jgi:AAA family ATP:ADP antiporter
MSSLTKALNVRPGEGRLLALLLAVFFLKGICDVSVATTASALFLSAFRSTTLPYVYIVAAAIVTILGIAYSSLATRLAVPTLFRITVIFSVITIAAFHFTLSSVQSKPWVLGLMIWREVVYMLLNVACWAQVALLFNVRQSKRLFPLIAAGDIASMAIFGIAIPLIVSRIGALHLLFFAEASIAICLLLGVYIARAAVSSDDTLEETAADSTPISKLLKERYVSLFFAVSIVSFLIFFFADYNFYDVVNRHYQSAETLAAFFGVFYAVLNGFNLLLNAVSSRILTRYGIYAGLLAVPLFVGAGTLISIALPAFGLTAVLFWAVIITKLMDEMLRGAFLIPTVKVLYQPLPDRERLRIQAVRESVVEPVAIGLSGLLLLVLTRQAGFEVAQLLWILMIIISVFMTLCALLRKQYVVVLGKALPGHSSAIKDQRALNSRYKDIDALKRDLASPNVDEVIHCFNLVEQANPLAAKLLLPTILKHELPEVRVYGLKWVQQHKDSRATLLVKSVIETEESPVVRSEALTTLAMLTGEST